MAVPCSGACCCILLRLAELCCFWLSCVPVRPAAACLVWLSWVPVRPAASCLVWLSCVALRAAAPSLPWLCCVVVCAVRNPTHFLSIAILTCTQLVRCATPLDFTKNSSCLLKACIQSFAAQGSLAQGSQWTSCVTSAAGGPTS